VTWVELRVSGSGTTRVATWVKDRLKTWIRGRARPKCARQGDFFASGKRPFCTREHQVYTRLIQQGDKVDSESNKNGQSGLKEEI
jgi:hypothetical protein